LYAAKIGDFSDVCVGEHTHVGAAGFILAINVYRDYRSHTA